jgi:hypothetical protein
MICITQCLCEHRHCIMATAWDDTKTNKESAEHDLRNALTQLVLDRVINNHCRICKSKKWHYESGRTRWRTMEEAKAPIEALQAANIASGDILESAGTA